MDVIKIPAPVDLAKFAPNLNNPDIRYGLPREIKFCNTCVVSNQRPNSTIEFKHTSASKKQTIAFDEGGTCDACKVAQEKKTTIDWAERESQLIALCDQFRRNDGGYDCLVPGSGGKDSFYAAHIIKHKYGMHPLTVTWAPHIYTEWGWKNQQAWINAGFDNILVTPNGLVHRLLTRLSVENLFHPFQPFIIGQKNLAPKLALRFGIPLIFFGEDETEYGNPVAEKQNAQRNYDYFTNNDKSEIFFGGTSVTDLVQNFGVEPYELEMYMPEEPQKLRELGVEVHYLGYYLKWHPQSCYYYAVEHGGFQPSPERTPGTYSKYSSIDDRIDDFHYYTSFIKFGIGRATEDAAQEVRSLDIERDEAIALVRRFDGEFPDRFADEIFAYLSIPQEQFPIASGKFEQPTMTREHFDMLTDNFRSPHLWKHENGHWKLRHRVFD